MLILPAAFTALALGLTALLVHPGSHRRAPAPRATPVQTRPGYLRTYAVRRVCGLALAIALGPAFLPLPTAAGAGSDPAVQVSVVQVLGRSWHVAPVVENHSEDGRLSSGRYMAQRQNAEFDPLRPPAVLTAKQAVRAFYAATGCRARIDTMVRSINGTYFADLVCR
ncbi:hypothetical protein [Phaeobacter gallaeciensis]|uniref:Uncharacterized protein n=1 Tax=Phaeobacter gallaeciensis TaxID=60890 RepID=A0AAD0ECE9_9RHOB|nr:hypothetical protein [Phaeobacter gallaeciensis]AHD10685.1 hypothetical protein Gal_02955 [Phaeobacter gallaeciensis DSM 26640]ATE93948.1 hypothetical protein PhaeoP11_02943 [Phaeobacter gallaeciensis]ATE96231.1 hypothetical protein PhaeoP73_00904 [Phaeobacter gallaeciensis]ATF02612.1 hypothetical protein PhaeoP75_02992 [Phaeobacter gallaeciensis]ATF06992.1 hypothetical protein PhaeoP63_02941 [Phaeobacter gallaeciensis]